MLLKLKEVIKINKIELVKKTNNNVIKTTQEAFNLKPFLEKQKIALNILQKISDMAKCDDFLLVTFFTSLDNELLVKIDLELDEYNKLENKIK